MFNVKTTIVDSDGNTFSREWKSTVNRLDAIRWTVESQDVPFYVYVDKIAEVKVELVSEEK
jgi:hypothetical protein